MYLYVCGYQLDGGGGMKQVDWIGEVIEELIQLFWFVGCQ